MPLVGLPQNHLQDLPTTLLHPYQQQQQQTLLVPSLQAQPNLASTATNACLLPTANDVQAAAPATGLTNGVMVFNNDQVSVMQFRLSLVIASC